MRRSRRLLASIAAACLVLVLVSAVPLGALFAAQHLDCGCIGVCVCGHAQTHAACARETTDEDAPKLESCHTEENDSVTTRLYELTAEPRTLFFHPASERLAIAVPTTLSSPHAPETPPPRASRFSS